MRDRKVVVSSDEWQGTRYIYSIEPVQRGGGVTQAIEDWWDYEVPFAIHEPRTTTEVVMDDMDQVERHLRNGWKEIYGRRSTLSSTQDRYWLTEVIDPHGLKERVEYRKKNWGQRNRKNA